MPGTYNTPVHLTHAGDGSGRLFVVEKAGTIRIIQDGQLLPDPFLDIRDRVNADCNECGLLSIAFPPGFENDGYFFVYYTATENVADPEPSDEGKESGNDTVVARFRLGADANQADLESEERILLRNQPYENHNGGLITFGPDGYLYVGLGDGGSSNDPLNNAQDPSTLLGKLLRLEVGATGTYTVPANNPFVDSPTHRPEIWATGLRNPWRYSFDRLTGDLYIADVGQNAYEEINRQPGDSSGGENYGWKIMEGAHCRPPQDDCDRQGLILPIHEYPHSTDPCDSITGGNVYRGLNPEWQGIYFFADYCTGRISGLRPQGGQWEASQLLETAISISSFGEDRLGNLYVVGRGPDELGRRVGGVYRLIDPARPTSNALYLPSLLSTATQ